MLIKNRSKMCEDDLTQARRPVIIGETRCVSSMESQDEQLAHGWVTLARRITDQHPGDTAFHIIDQGDRGERVAWAMVTVPDHQVSERESEGWER